MTREEFMNLEINKEFVAGCLTVKVVEVKEYGCTGCIFKEGGCSSIRKYNIIPYCDSERRRDDKDVIFVEVEE